MTKRFTASLEREPKTHTSCISLNRRFIGIEFSACLFIISREQQLSQVAGRFVFVETASTLHTTDIGAYFRIVTNIYTWGRRDCIVLQNDAWLSC